MFRTEGGERSPAIKLLFAILVGVALAIPIFVVWALVYDRQSQSQQATASITEGWGGPQAFAGPTLVIPYRTTARETVVQNGQSVTRSTEVVRELTLAPEAVELTTDIRPELRKRSIYQAVVYDAKASGRARFALPADLAQSGVDLAKANLGAAELRFALSDPRGLGANPRVIADGRPLRLQPGGGSGAAAGRGFFAWIDAASLSSKPIVVDFQFDFRGNAALSLAPQAGDTRWTVRSSWPHPSFAGDFLPVGRTIGSDGFQATYRVGNLALGRSLVSTSDIGTPSLVERIAPPSPIAARATTNATDAGSVQTAQISLIQPVDLYSQVDRATKYGFLFVAFTFLALLMFDIIGGVRVSSVEYLLMGAALVLFFVLLLALAEVIGFTPAYILAAAAIAGLNTAYSAAVLGSWRRAWFIGGLLVALYAVLYILLSLEAFSLLIGSLLLFAALAGVMYATRRIDWGASRAIAE
ncbi:cell envelope integrity protein CreD [Sphingomonas sinipercae]|uniref:Cell envelope integrity protein CreD n=1 Tax=Sphingomonas sinipercae TaxID=2714944 RepID=A0A6G7ZLJ3_9SPHN|nr:cell envelope integrity protein CreD [Sphingomonas sinipercae]QIL01795.1 cell envelope integrity protein CreD [Sphingomonas sinipercae]